MGKKGTKCKVCEGATADGIWLCDSDAAVLQEALVSVPALIEDLDITISRQSATYHDENTGSKGTKKVHAPMPIDVDASEASTALGRCVLTWHAALGFIFKPSTSGEYRALSPKDPTYIPQRMTRAVIAVRDMSNKIDYIRGVEGCGECFTEIMAAINLGLQCIDSKSPERIYGYCDCGQILYGRAGQCDTICASCGIQHRVSQLQDGLRRRISGKVGTVSEIAGLLRVSGYEVGASTLRRWAANNKITNQGFNSRNHPMYSYTECLMRYRALHPEKEEHALSA